MRFDFSQVFGLISTITDFDFVLFFFQLLICFRAFFPSVTDLLPCFFSHPYWFAFVFFSSVTELLLCSFFPSYWFALVFFPSYRFSLVFFFHCYCFSFVFFPHRYCFSFVFFFPLLLIYLRGFFFPVTDFLLRFLHSREQGGRGRDKTVGKKGRSPHLKWVDETVRNSRNAFVILRTDFEYRCFLQKFTPVARTSFRSFLFLFFLPHAFLTLCGP